MDRTLLNSRSKPTQLPPEYQARLASYCAHQILEDTAAQFPEVLAISAGGREYTYREVNEFADRIARFIVARDLPIESAVGVFADRSPELIFAFAGVLKSGCAYVPIDPLHPLDRLNFMLTEMQARLILTGDDPHPFGDVPGVEFVRLRSILDAPPAQPAGYPRTVKPENLAYIIFTSGSTGRPKGAMLEHRGLVNFCYYFKHFHDYKVGDRCAQMVRPGFDATMGEIAGFFFNGVAVFIPENAVMENPARLAEFIVRNKITRGFAATPLGELLIEEEWPESGVAMIELQMGGETLRKRPSARFPFLITNVYGPTENTNISTEYVMVENSDKDPRLPPIGYPLANTETLILSEDLKPVKPGQEGELFLGGIQVARGYLNRPDLTREKFIPHPFSSVPGARLYRSGDLVRERDDGAIEYISRIDFQVKIRGYRIELGEIEAVLNARPGVRQAVVVALLKDGKPDQLAAYWVPDPTHNIKSAVLADDLRARLPEAMVPKYFVAIDVLPLSPNGKIDRKNLPPPADSAAEQRDETTAAPTGELETKLAAIWRDILNNPVIGVRDRFIDVGGTSLSALRIVSRIRRELSHDIPVGRIYEAATIAALAASILRPQAPAPAQVCLICIQPGAPGHAPIFCVHGFGGHIYQYYLLAKYLGPDQPVYALRGSGLEPGEVADDTCAKMAARYAKEILPVAKGGIVHLCGYSLGGFIVLEIARQLQAAKLPVGVIGVLDQYGPGYPIKLPFKQRLKIHLRTVLVAGWSEKKKYIAKRLNNITERIYFLFRIPYVHPEERRGTEEIIPDTVFWAHRNAFEKYPFEHYDGAIVLFRATTSPDWPGNRFDDRNLGWSPIVKSIEVFDVPGDHWTIIQDPNIRRVAEVLLDCVRR